MGHRETGLADILTRPSLIAVAGVHHGLGNRVRSVLGSEILARIEGRAFAYAWPTGRPFGAGLTELWEYDRLRLPAPLSRVATAWSPYRDGTLGWLDDAARTDRVWQIRTAHALALPPEHRWEDELRALRPVREVRERTMAVFGQHLAGRRYVGIMVRSHSNSHRETLRHSPVEWYLGRMHEIRAAWPDAGFFVSADTEEALRRIQLEFPDALSQHDKGGYNSGRALVASVADLYLLAASSHVLGPHYSSFPELAVKLADHGVLLETARNGVSLRFDAGASVAVDPLRPSERQTL